LAEAGRSIKESPANGVEFGELYRAFIFSGVPGPGGMRSRVMTMIRKKIIRIASESLIGRLQIVQIPTSDCGSVPEDYA
jgi:hypothetical protein